jgi:hypothetical protein
VVGEYYQEVPVIPVSDNTLLTNQHAYANMYLMTNVIIPSANENVVPKPSDEALRQFLDLDNAGPARTAESVKAEFGQIVDQDLQEQAASRLPAATPERPRHRVAKTIAAGAGIAGLLLSAKYGLEHSDMYGKAREKAEQPQSNDEPAKAETNK